MVLSSLKAHGQVNLAVMREACPEGLEHPGVLIPCLPCRGLDSSHGRRAGVPLPHPFYSAET